jgi:hypothetical protein
MTGQNGWYSEADFGLSVLGSIVEARSQNQRVDYFVRVCSFFPWSRNRKKHVFSSMIAIHVGWNGSTTTKWGGEEKSNVRKDMSHKAARTALSSRTMAASSYVSDRAS